MLPRSSSNVKSALFLARRFGGDARTYDSSEISRIVDSRCYFAVLNLNEESSQKDIKEAYSSLVKRYHPDVCRLENSQEIFRKITESYAVLSNQQLRAQYATMRSAGRSPKVDRSEFQEDVYGDFKDQRNAKNHKQYNYWEEDRRSFDSRYKEWVRQGQERREKERQENTAREAQENSHFSKILLFTVGAACLFVGGYTDFFKNPFKSGTSASDSQDPKRNFQQTSNAVSRAMSPDGVMSDSPAVIQARFNQVKKEFESKNIVIEVKPNKLHSKYQKLAKEPDHIRYINLVLKKSNNGLTITKSESIYADASFRRTITLEEHRDLFNDMLVARDSGELEVAITKLKSGVENRVKPKQHPHFNEKTGQFTPDNYI